MGQIMKLPVHFVGFIYVQWKLYHSFVHKSLWISNWFHVIEYLAHIIKRNGMFLGEISIYLVFRPTPQSFLSFINWTNSISVMGTKQWPSFEYRLSVIAIRWARWVSSTLIACNKNWTILQPFNLPGLIKSQSNSNIYCLNHKIIGRAVIVLV